MSIENILSPNNVFIDLRVNCKRELLSGLANKAAELVDVDADSVLEILQEREQLGSTGVGDGVAIPHGKIEDLGQITGIFARIEKPIDFDALDSKPVDLFFLLLAPTNATAAHLKALAKIARLLRDEDTRKTLRAADTPATLHAIITSERNKSDAA